MKSYRRLTDIELVGKKVILRAGLDVPIENGRVTDVSRIEAAIPTMQYILDHGAALIIIAHQDRPKGKVVAEMSQKPIVPILEKLLGRSVGFAESCIGPETKQMVDALAPGQVILLENLRFYPGEETNDEKFASELAALGEVYVNDAFPNCHREHASVVAIAKLLPSYMGLELEEEVKHLTLVLENPKKPVTLIISGAKVETKLPIIQTFLESGDDILVGGGVANTLLVSSEKNVGTSLVDDEFVDAGTSILAESGKNGSAMIHQPVDAVIAASPEKADTAITASVDDIPGDQAIYDIGPKTVDAYAAVIRESATILWNGPLGMYEVPQFGVASKAIALELASASSRGAVVIIGGGDTLDFLAREHIDLSSFTFVSTGGGAMLEFLSGKALPALEALSS